MRRKSLGNNLSNRLGKDYIVEGHRIRLYTCGELTRMVGIRGPKTLKAWEKEGLLPPPTFRGPRNMRLYSISQVNFLRSLIRWYKVGRWKWRDKGLEEFKRRLWEGFPQKAVADLDRAAGRGRMKEGARKHEKEPDKEERPG